MVSIHAPTKGATDIERLLLGEPRCFNPRSHEGSDFRIFSHMPLMHRFQSTLPRRERQETRVTLARYQTVSIHAPTKGATPSSVFGSADRSRFNPRSHEGSDVYVRVAHISRSVFQSTLPRRERRSFHAVATLPSLFQSTLPRRERLYDLRHM